MAQKKFVKIGTMIKIEKRTMKAVFIKGNWYPNWAVKETTSQGVLIRKDIYIQKKIENTKEDIKRLNNQLLSIKNNPIQNDPFCSLDLGKQKNLQKKKVIDIINYRNQYFKYLEQLLNS